MDINQSIEDMKKENKRLNSYEWTTLRQQVLERDCSCVECSSSDGLQVDHIKPKCIGGTDSLENLQTLCEKCHKKKTVQDIEMLRRLRKLNHYRTRIGGFD